MNLLWQTKKTDPTFIKYFPDSCLKRQPPKSYFWKVYFHCFKSEFNTNITTQIDSLIKKNRVKDDNVLLTDEAVDIFENFNFKQNLKLLGLIISKKRY